MTPKNLQPTNRGCTPRLLIDAEIIRTLAFDISHNPYKYEQLVVCNNPD